MVGSASAWDFVSKEQVERVRAPIAVARGLPSRTYIDPGFHALELERIFTRRWVAVTFTHRVAQPGDAVPCTVAGQPVAVVRGDDGVLRAFHNVCAYDACEAVHAAARGLDHLVGRYHGWVWDLRGRLRAIPYWDGTPDPSPGVLGDSGGDLVEVACEAWRDLVFVRLAGEGPELAEHLAPLSERIADYDLTGFGITRTEGGEPYVSSSEIPGNWKLALENDFEVYHEAFVHEDYAASPHSPKADGNGNPTYTPVFDRGLIGLDMPTQMYFDEEALAELPLVPVAGHPYMPLAHIYNLYPNVQVGFMANHYSLGILMPDGPERTQNEVTYYVHASVASEPELARGIAAAWEKSRHEDNVAVAATQRGRHSRLFEQTTYSPFWDATLQAFHQLVLDDLLAAEP